MHPEVVQEGPGSCPKCGMALEPRTVSLEEEEQNPEYEDMREAVHRRRHPHGAAGDHRHAGHAAGRPLHRGNWPRTRTSNWLELVLATPVVLWAGWVFYVRAVQSVINHSLNMFTLIGLGVSVAYIYSLVGVLLPGIFPAAMRGPGGAVGVYFEAAAVIVTLILLGQVLELKARSQTGAAIKALLGWPRKPPARSTTTAAKPTSPWSRCRSATGCGSGRAKRCRWTAPFSTAAARWTNR